MADLIRLLPDFVANQIAAGEVVQRPASAVKELLENAVDAGATSIKLIIKEAGKNLIQVIDNGSGMSERDARMCFERHATSKIETANDLLAIHTLGFRGEALASIASIAQVELRSKRAVDEVGTSIRIEGSEFVSQSPVTIPDGTNILVKNLFYNVPARRNFLKSNTLELKYIIEEFCRVAFVNPSIAFTFYNNDKILHQIPGSNLKMRLVNLLGNNYNQRLVPVEQQTGIVDVEGFIGKPEFAKKTRGEQYFFANGRFIKNAYLHHAIENAFRELIPSDSFPTYFLYLTVDPKTIDINIHPTKTEINFQDIKSIYAIIHSAVKQSIGKFNISPTLDFETERSLNLAPIPEGKIISQPVIKVNPDYNPFEKKGFQQERSASLSDQRGWKPLYDPLKDIRFTVDNQETTQHILSNWDEKEDRQSNFRSIQVQNKYIVTHTRSGIMVIDQNNAHERILYERFLLNLEKNNPVAQHQLLPVNVPLSSGDAGLIKEHITDLCNAGFEISDFGNNTVIVHAIPSGCNNDDIPAVIEKILENLKRNGSTGDNPNAAIAKTLAKSLAIPDNKKLQPEEINGLVEQLFACNVPEVTPDGKPVMMIIGFDELNRKFK